MPAARPLTFLYPQLLRAARSAAAAGASTRAWAAATRAKSSFAPRVGKAVEPGSWEPQQGQLSQAALPLAKQEDVEPLLDRLEAARAGKKGVAEPNGAPEETSEPTPRPEEPTETDVKPSASDAGEPLSVTPSKEATESDKASQEEDERLRQMRKETRPGGPLEAVLHIRSPEQAAKQHLHMSPPPYVHHFDSYSLVKQLQDGGYSQEHATTAMKAIRALLAQNLDVAQQSLVSKSNVENEAYLFKAACSELATEIMNNRRLRDEQMRQHRTHLQHEVDILTQSLNQELLTLTDNVRGMFNDRKMAVREEQKAAESAIQKINYKISIMLSSDSKSEIEGVRWILIRRSVLGIIFMAIVTLGVLRYATYVRQKKKKEADRRRKEKERMRRDGGKTDNLAAADAAAVLTAS